MLEFVEVYRSGNQDESVVFRNDGQATFDGLMAMVMYKTFSELLLSLQENTPPPSVVDYHVVVTGSYEDRVIPIKPGHIIQTYIETAVDNNRAVLDSYGLKVGIGYTDESIYVTFTSEFGPDEDEDSDQPDGDTPNV